MSEKINLEEILLENHFHMLDILKKVYSPDTYNESMYERLMNGIREVCKQTLELAAENSKEFADTSEVKQSILNTINQIE